MTLLDNWFISAHKPPSPSHPTFLTQQSFTSEENIRLHLTVLSRIFPRVYYWKNKKGFDYTVLSREFSNKIKELNSEGNKLHLCVNTPSGRRLIENMKTMNCLAADIDSTHGDQPATPEQKQEAYDQALRLQNYLKQKYDLTSFIVDSGNGWHLYIPIGNLEIPQGKQFEYNEKSKTFWNAVKTDIGINLDHTGDISRVLTLAGSINTKYPDKSMPVFFLNPDNLSFTDFKKRIEESKPHNLAIIQTIFETLEVDIAKTTKPIKRNYVSQNVGREKKRAIDFVSPEDIFNNQMNSLAFCMTQDHKLAEIIGKELVAANGNQGADDFQLIRRLDYFNFGEAEKIAIFKKYRVYLSDGQPREKFRLESVDYCLDRLLRDAVSDIHWGKHREIKIWG